MSVEKPTLVKVTWLDAWGAEQPHTLSEIQEFRPQKRESVGFLLEDNKKCVKIAMSYVPSDSKATAFEEDVYDNIGVIPKGMVLQVKELKEVE